MRFTKKRFLLGLWLSGAILLFALAIYDTQDILPAVFSGLSLSDEAFLPKLPGADNVWAVHLPYGFFTSSQRDKVLSDIQGTQLNGVELTVKDEVGRIAFFDREAEKNVADFVTKSHEQGIYTIARVVVFQDARLISRRPELALRNTNGNVWKTFAGASWVDPTRPEVCEYNATIAKKALAVGFDEINFDYIRFPSDGPMEEIIYSDPKGISDKVGVLESCFAVLRESLGQAATLSIDVFGMTFVLEDIGIGQIIERAAAYFDVIAPMSYPSHYPPNFMGYENPALYPYEVVSATLKKGLSRLAAVNSTKQGIAGDVIVRPWIQNFDLGAVYDVEKIQAQIKAAGDHGISTWMLWNARGEYTYEAIPNAKFKNQNEK